MLLARIDEVIE